MIFGIYPPFRGKRVPQGVARYEISRILLFSGSLRVEFASNLRSPAVDRVRLSDNYELAV